MEPGEGLDFQLTAGVPASPCCPGGRSWLGPEKGCRGTEKPPVNVAREAQLLNCDRRVPMSGGAAGRPCTEGEAGLGWCEQGRTPACPRSASPCASLLPFLWLCPASAATSTQPHPAEPPSGPGRGHQLRVPERGTRSGRSFERGNDKKILSGSLGPLLSQTSSALLCTSYSSPKGDGVFRWSLGWGSRSGSQALPGPGGSEHPGARGAGGTALPSCVAATAVVFPL